jgi:hypothetical protein
MKDQKERTELISRRSVLTGSALLLTGGIAGRISNAVAAPAPPSAPAPPLPWKWTKLDPLEARQMGAVESHHLLYRVPRPGRISELQGRHEPPAGPNGVPALPRGSQQVGRRGSAEGVLTFL